MEILVVVASSCRSVAGRSERTASYVVGCLARSAPVGLECNLIQAALLTRRARFLCLLTDVDVATGERLARLMRLV